MPAASRPNSLTRFRATNLLPKLLVAGSNPVTRSNKIKHLHRLFVG